MTVVSRDELWTPCLEGAKIYRVERVASGAIAASVMRVLGKHIVNLTLPPYVITQQFPDWHFHGVVGPAPARVKSPDKSTFDNLPIIIKANKREYTTRSESNR